MKKKSEFSSKKVSEFETKRRKKSVKIPEPKKNNDFFEDQEIKQDLQSFYNSEAKKYAETRRKFWHEEKAILDAITPLFGNVISNECEKSTGQMESDTHMDPHASFHSAQDDDTPMDSSANASEGHEAFPLFKEGGPLAVGDLKNPHPDKSGSSFKKEQSRKVRVLEFGCGSGRFATLLNQNFPGKFDYVGIDLSDELLSYASKENPNLTFFQGDITKLIKNFEQESFDLIVGTSSFQHIPTSKERSFLMKNFYRLLDYDGMLLMTNWSLSKWFVKKHRKAVLKARFMSLIQFNRSKSRDIMVPWTDSKTGKVYERFYHFFSLEELNRLAIFSGLTIKVNNYIDEGGEFTNDERISRSSLFISTKSPILN